MKNFKLWLWRKKNAKQEKQEKLIILGAEGELNKKRKFWRKDNGPIKSSWKEKYLI